MSKNITLITGANQGIGLALAKSLLLSSSNRHILLGCRDMTKGEKASTTLRSLPDIKGTVEPLLIDVTSDESVDAAAAHIDATHGRLDTLVNNAGVSSMQRGRGEARNTFAVNVIGAISVTDAMLPLLKKSESPRLVFVSSTMGCITKAADPADKMHFDFANEYRASKAAVNMLMVQYQQYQIERTHGFDPGMVATYFGAGEAAGSAILERKRGMGAVEPDESIGKLVEILEGKWDEHKGKVISREHDVLPW